MPPVPIDPAALANAGANLLNAFWGRNQANRSREDRLAAGENVLNYINDNGLPDGYMQNAYQQLLLQYFNNNQNYQNQHDGLQNIFYSGIGDYRNSFDKINTPELDNPVLQYLRSQVENGQSQTNPAIDNFLRIAQDGGVTPNTQQLFDTFTQHGSMANPYIRNLVDVGGHMLQNDGMTPYTQNASDVAGYFIRNGGMDDNTQRLYDAGFQNRDVAAGGLARADNLSRQGQNTLNFGQNLIQDTQRSGGWDPNTFSQFQTGMNGLDWVKNYFSQIDPTSVLGATGQQAIQQTMNNPFTQQGFDTTRGVLNNVMNRPDISENDQALINSSFGKVFGGMDPIMATNTGIAQGVAGQDVNTLAPWFSQFSSQGGDLMSKIMSMVNTSGSIPGGGGGGSVSYTPMSRDLGPADPKVQEYFEKALAEFEKNPLMSDKDVTSFARDQASTSAKNQALAAQRRAVMMGGNAPTVWGGGQDGAMRSFADEAMQLEAKSVQDALMKNAELKLTRSGQQSDLAKALAQAKLGREQIFGNMNIADANNATQVGVANASAAEGAANRSTQAAIAQMTNNAGLMKIASEIFGNLMNNATTQRGQNVTSQVAGIDSLDDLYNADSSRRKIFADILNDATKRGQDQYQANLKATTDLTGQLSQYGAQRNTAMDSILDAITKASEQVTSRGNTMFSNYTSLINNAGKDAASRYDTGMKAGADVMKTGMGGMADGVTGYNNATGRMNDALGISQGALGAANTRLGHYSDIFKTATDDSTSRMRLGADMTSQGMKSMNDFLANALGVTKQQNDYALGMGRLGSDLYKTNQDANSAYGNTAASFAQTDLGNRKLMSDTFANFLGNLNLGIGNNISAWQQSNAPYAGVLGQQLQYLNGTQSLVGNYSGMFGRG